MKILLYSDNHWSQYSSIIRKRGKKYSLRLENQIQSINWAMNLAREKGCFMTVCLGDFFDKAELNSEEISALKDIEWAPMSNYFIAGNHEMGSQDNEYSSAKLFNLLDTGEVFTQLTKICIDKDTKLWLLPYTLEGNRVDLSRIAMEQHNEKAKNIILSHNDIKGINYGGFISNIGYSIEDIENCCDLFINGHLHNGERISKKIFNIGNLTGQNFSEDASKYDHCVFILDTDTLSIEEYVNPFAFNFYKFEYEDLLQAKELKNNSVITVKCSENQLFHCKELLTNLDVIESRVIITKEEKRNSEEIKNLIQKLSVDHLKAFSTYMLDNFPNTDVLENELYEVCS